MGRLLSKTDYTSIGTIRMPRRHILTERQRSALLDLPIDELSLLRHYTLGDDDLGHIQERRRPENRLGFALQLCALRYPGRALAPGEVSAAKRKMRVRQTNVSRHPQFLSANLVMKRQIGQCPNSTRKRTKHV